MNKKTLVINIFSGPGVGKSTMAAGLFYELKMAGVECEMALEYAKDKVWEESYKVLKNQLYVTAKQYHRLKILEKKVDVIITDSPMLLGLYYGKNEPKEYTEMVKRYTNNFNNFNIFLKRIYDYNPNGRLQSEKDAVKIDEYLLEILKEYPHQIYEPNKENLKKIAKDILLNHIHKNENKKT